jgi:hypothetical protein
MQQQIDCGINKRTFLPVVEEKALASHRPLFLTVPKPPMVKASIAGRRDRMIIFIVE